ncbi:MAG: HD domain-containing protein [Chloroflexi bacterium]|nr:HD domain-containing protein [Chloroflexota bacterium]
MIRLAAVVHDIGKVGVPAEILSKPGQISDIEFSLIKAHPQIAFDILGKAGLPWPIAQIVLQHHERIDGSGYPSGLRGEDTPLGARILAVAFLLHIQHPGNRYSHGHSGLRLRRYGGASGHTGSTERNRAAAGRGCKKVLLDFANSVAGPSGCFSQQAWQVTFNL